MTINEYFDKVLFINLARRTDRLEHAVEQFKAQGIEAERIDGVDLGEHMGNHGCTAAHRKALDMIVENGWKRTLVMEDDIQFIYPDTQERFARFVEAVPRDWFMIYLAGHYGNIPFRRASEGVIQFDHMKTTTAYGITLEAATIMAPQIEGCGPIDELYSGFSHVHPCYIIDPRIAVQYGNYSDIERRITLNEGCMTDGWHASQV